MIFITWRRPPKKENCLWRKTTFLFLHGALSEEISTVVVAVVQRDFWNFVRLRIKIGLAHIAVFFFGWASKGLFSQSLSLHSARDTKSLPRNANYYFHDFFLVYRFGAATWLLHGICIYLHCGSCLLMPFMCHNSFLIHPTDVAVVFFSRNENVSKQFLYQMFAFASFNVSLFSFSTLFCHSNI